MNIIGAHFNYYLVCHRKLWLFAGGRYILTRLKMIIPCLRHLSNQGMTMFYQYNVPDGTIKMIRFMNSEKRTRNDIRADWTTKTICTRI